MLSKLPTLILMMCCHQLTCSDTFEWRPHWMPDRTDLKCKTYCETNHGNDAEQSYDKKALDKCCVCRSSTTWEDSLEDMYIEFTTVLGGSIAISSESVLNTTYYKIYHTHSVMTSLPSNLCDVTYLMKLDFSDNHITSLQGIDCAYNIDTLDLSNNEIIIFKNTAFAMLKNLRIVDLSNNKIAYIEPNAFTSINVRLFSIDLSSNDLTTVDVSNLTGLYPFCRIDYQYNKITEVINLTNFTLDLNKTYGPGYIDLKYNLMETIPDYKTLFLLEDLNVIGKLIEFGIDIRGSPIICDCRMSTFLELAEDLKKSVWVNHHNVTCTGPDNHLGKMVSDVPLNELICHLKVENGCPVGCSCIDEPHKNTITIKCVNAFLTEFPGKLPVSKFSDQIDLNVANNSITEIPSHLDYLDRINNLNIGFNDLTKVTEEVASLLENATEITLEGNDRLNTLPQQFQFISPCDLQLDGIILICDCSMTWLTNWLSTKTCQNLSQFYCDVVGEGIIGVRGFRKGMLECFIDFEKLIQELVIGLSIALLVIVLTATLVFVFRYELLVIYVRLITQNLLGKQDVAGMAGIKHHAVLSFDECNEQLQNWVLNARRYLTNKGYAVCVPVVDIIHGARDEEVIKEMNKSACVIVVLSDSYANDQCPEDDSDSLERPWFENEWKYAWNKLCGRPSKRLILVNYDHLAPGEVSHRRMKAYLRVGKVIDFTNTNRDIMSTIEKELGDLSLPSVKTNYQQTKPRIDLTKLTYFNDSGNVSISENNEMMSMHGNFKYPTKMSGIFRSEEADDTVLSSKEHSKGPNRKIMIGRGSKVAPMPFLPVFNPRTLLDTEKKIEEVDKTDSNDNMDITGAEPQKSENIVKVLKLSKGCLEMLES